MSRLKLKLHAAEAGGVFPMPGKVGCRLKLRLHAAEAGGVSGDLRTVVAMDNLASTKVLQ